MSGKQRGLDAPGEGCELPQNNLQRFREAQMLSKAELARKAGLSTLTIDRIEAGRPCRLDTKRKILHALDMKVSDGPRVFGNAEAAGSVDSPLTPLHQEGTPRVERA